MIMQTGMYVRVHPPGIVSSDDHKFVIERVTWEDGACKDTETVVFENVDMTACPEDPFQAKLWMLDALEVAAQILSNEIAKISPPSIKKSDASGVRASETPSQTM